MKNSNQNSGKASKTRVILDLFFFILMIAVLIPQSTGIDIHEWLSFLILIFQAFLISILLLFNVLNYRTQRHFIPALEYKNFIA